MSLFDHEDPPDAPLPAAEPVRLGRGIPSPWQGLPAPSFPDGHDETTCPVCSPAYATEAWRRGVDKANRDADPIATSGVESPHGAGSGPSDEVAKPEAPQVRPALRFPLT